MVRVRVVSKDGPHFRLAFFHFESFEVDSLTRRTGSQYSASLDGEDGGTQTGEDGEGGESMVPGTGEGGEITGTRRAERLKAPAIYRMLSYYRNLATS